MGFETGRKSSIGVTAVALTATSTPCEAVTVRAPATNSVNVYVAARSTVTADSADATDGYQLAPGDLHIFNIDDPNKLYAISTAASQKLFWKTE